MDWASSNVAKWLHNPNTMQKNNVHTIEPNFGDDEKIIIEFCCLFFIFFSFWLVFPSFCVVTRSSSKWKYLNLAVILFKQLHFNLFAHTHQHTHTTQSKHHRQTKVNEREQKEHANVFKWIHSNATESTKLCIVCVFSCCLPFVDCENNSYFFWLHAFFSIYVVVVRKRCLDFYFHFKMHFSLVFFLMPFVLYATEQCVCCFFFHASHFDVVRAFYHFHHTFIAILKIFFQHRLLKWKCYKF